jgi:hypothetical protein
MHGPRRRAEELKCRTDPFPAVVGEFGKRLGGTLNPHQLDEQDSRWRYEEKISNCQSGYVSVLACCNRDACLIGQEESYVRDEQDGAICLTSAP